MPTSVDCSLLLLGSVPSPPSGQDFYPPASAEKAACAAVLLRPGALLQCVYY